MQDATMQKSLMRDPSMQGHTRKLGVLVHERANERASERANDGNRRLCNAEDLDNEDRCRVN
jgi:hypothetical protein